MCIHRNCSCIIRVSTHGHQCVSWTREKLRAGMYLRMQVRIQPHPVGSPLGVGDFSRISHGLSRTIGCKVQVNHIAKCMWHGHPGVSYLGVLRNSCLWQDRNPKPAGIGRSCRLGSMSLCCQSEIFPVPKIAAHLRYLVASTTKSWFVCFGREAHEQCLNPKFLEIKQNLVSGR